MSTLEKKLVAQYDCSADELFLFLGLIKFLIDSPEYFGWRGKKKPELTNETGIMEIAAKFFAKRMEKIVPSTPSTIPDELVSLIMIQFYGYNQKDAERIKTEHQHSMAAENIVGEMLERYLASKIETLGWIWCPSSLVKHTDFIKFEEGKWKLLQIKNRDNSENSSSSAIRGGTEIIKWFRCYSKTGLTNWDNFPDKRARLLLSEKEFHSYVKSMLS